MFSMNWSPYMPIRRIGVRGHYTVPCALKLWIFLIAPLVIL